MALRIAHLTDFHLQPERGAYEGVLRAFALAEQESAELLLLGGDYVMNSVGATWQRAQAQWDLWTQVRKAHPKLPFIACLGNQDCWGWNTKASGATGSEPLFGKGLALEKLGLEKTYGVHEVGAWRLIVLDGIQRGGRHGFTPRLDPEQLDWFKETLSQSKKPTLLLTHVSLVPGPGDFFGMNILEPAPEGFWPLPDHEVHADGYQLIELLRQHPNVKLCLAGHTHVPQRIDYVGITFLCSAAVCGEWWRGHMLGTAPGLTLVDLHEDGRFDFRFLDIPKV